MQLLAFLKFVNVVYKRLAFFQLRVLLTLQLLTLAPYHLVLIVLESNITWFHSSLRMLLTGYLAILIKVIQTDQTCSNKLIEP